MSSFRLNSEGPTIASEVWLDDTDKLAELPPEIRRWVLFEANQSYSVAAILQWISQYGERLAFVLLKRGDRDVFLESFKRD